MHRRHFLLASTGGVLGAALPGVVFANETTSVVVKLALRGQRGLIPLSVSNADRYEFVLDTGGAFNLLSRELAEALGASRVGSAMLTVSRNRKVHDFVELADLVLGDTLAQTKMLFVVVDDIDFGEGAVGSISAAAVTAIDSQLDISGGTITLYPNGLPSGARIGHRTTKALGDVSPIGGARHLFVEGSVGGQAFRVTIDTGAPTPLRISEKVARAAGIDWTAQNWTPLWVEGRRIVPLLRSPTPVRLGGVEFVSPLVAVDRDASLGLPSDATAGLPLISKMVITTDSLSGDVYTRLGGAADDRKLERYNKAGLFLQQTGSDLRVTAVGRGSPAQQLGIEVGDRLKNAALRDFIDWMSKPAGTTRDLEVERGGASRPVTLTLAEFL